MKNHLFFLSCIACLRSRKSYKSFFKRANLAFSLLVAVMSYANFAQAAGNCLKDLFGPGPLVCTSDDVSIAKFAVLSGPTSCVIGQMITVGLQAQTRSSAQALPGGHSENGRYDVGYWIAIDGGNAMTGTCFDDYLPPPLTTTPSVNPTTSPFLDLNRNACGDVTKTSQTWRNIGGSTTPPGPPVLLSIPCVDKNNDGIADLSACTSWSNDSRHACSSQIGTLPQSGKRCNCDVVNLATITIDPCSVDADCPVNPNLCEPNRCINHTCVEVPVICPPPADICHTQGTCIPATGLCSNPSVVCDTPPECHTNPGTCVLPDGCTYPNQPDGTPCDGANHECEDGTCVPIAECTVASDCPLIQCSTATCPEGTCIYTPETGTPCGADDICSDGDCVECIVAENCPGANACNIATCDADRTCQYAPKDCNSADFGGGDEIKCVIDCCDPDVPGGCVHTPSNDECLILDDACNVGICGITGNCETEALTGDPCGDPSSCTDGICVLGSDNRASCEITFTCTPPDTCSTASCDGAGICTITSKCTCPEFCDNASPIGSCIEDDKDHERREEIGHDNFFSGGFLPQPPAPVPVAAVAPALAVVPVPEPITPVNNVPNISLSGDIKSAPLDIEDQASKSGASCATTGTDIKNLWMWMLMMTAAYAIRRKRACI